MQRTSDLDNNRKAILLLDSGDVLTAAALFRKNYFENPSGMTSVNYANFLLDEHNICVTSPFSAFKFRIHRSQARRILQKASQSYNDKTMAYHICCLLGQFYFDSQNLGCAKKHFSKAYQLNSYSIEALSALAWISFIEERYDDLKLQLVTLQKLLQLGDGLSANLEIIFDKCPFTVYPYYQLLIIAHSMTGGYVQACDLLDQLCTPPANEEELRVPSSQLLALSLYLKRFDLIQDLMESLFASPLVTQSQISFLYSELKKVSSTNSLGAVYANKLKKMAPTYSRIFFRLRISTMHMRIAKMLYPRGAFNGKECHYIACPIHQNC